MDEISISKGREAEELTMKFIFNIKVMFLSLAVASCGPTILPTAYSINSADYPLPGEVITAEVGEKLINQVYEEQFTGIKIMNEYDCCNFANACAQIESGQIFQEFMINGNINYCGAVKLIDAFRISAVEVPNYCFKINSKENLVGQNFNTCPDVEFEKGKFTRISNKNFQRSLYNKGKSGKEVYFDYREFKDDFARPAFTQDLIFDLSESNIFGYKGARIRVIDVSNIEIKYELISSFISTD